MLEEYYYIYLSKEEKMIAVKPTIRSFKKSLPSYLQEINDYEHTHKVINNKPEQFVSLAAFLDQKNNPDTTNVIA